jgi:carbamoyltransferase
MRILGIHDSHNATAALLVDGKLVAAVQEERLTGEKNQYGIPRLAIQNILNMTGLRMEEIDCFVRAEQSELYMLKPKPMAAPYMIITFDVLPEKREEMKAALHPYDWTARPQEVTREWNPDYYRILEQFAALTGRGILLNTSFNLHGYPIVYRAEDALKVFDNSGLEYLALSNFLVSKESLLE